MRSRYWLTTCSLALVALIGCGDEPTPFEEPIVPIVPSYDHVAYLEVTSPHPDDRAFLLTVTGPEPIDSVRPADTSLAVFSAARANGAIRIAVFGDVGDGVLLSFRVPDESRLDEYRVQLMEAAGPNGLLRDDEANYQLELRSEAD